MFSQVADLRSGRAVERVRRTTLRAPQRVCPAPGGGCVSCSRRRFDRVRAGLSPPVLTRVLLLPAVLLYRSSGARLAVAHPPTVTLLAHASHVVVPHAHDAHHREDRCARTCDRHHGLHECFPSPDSRAGPGLPDSAADQCGWYPALRCDKLRRVPPLLSGQGRVRRKRARRALETSLGTTRLNVQSRRAGCRPAHRAAARRPPAAGPTVPLRKGTRRDVRIVRRGPPDPGPCSRVR